MRRVVTMEGDGVGKAHVMVRFYDYFCWIHLLEITHCGYGACDELHESQRPGYQFDLWDEFYSVQ